MLILGLVVYFFLLLGLLAVWHWAIMRWSLTGLSAYLLAFVAGSVAYAGIYGLTSVDVFHAMRELWYICFADAYLAILAYDWIQSRYL